MKEIEDAIIKGILARPLPAWAIKKHPTKQGMSSINSIAVTDRLNEAFGLNGWTLDASIEQLDKQTGTYKNGNTYEKMMIVAKVRISFADGSYKETYGGNDNADLGDAYKGAVTDALTKIGSWLGIGTHVWKNDPDGSKGDADSNSGRGIDALVLALLDKSIGSEKQLQYLAKRLSSSTFNVTRMGLIEKLNNKEVSVKDAINKLSK